MFKCRDTKIPFGGVLGFGAMSPLVSLLEMLMMEEDDTCCYLALERIEELTTTNALVTWSDWLLLSLERFAGD
jgi:hypothetical protein